MIKKILLFATLLFAFSACSTLSKQAQEQLENKNYDEALVLYDRLVSEKPNEGEALEGQRKAREGVIDKNLIRVRLARIAQNYQESLDLLLEIVSKERSWNLYPSGAVAFTQKEETEEARKILNQQLANIQLEKKPLKTLYWIEHYRIIFDEKFQNYLTNYKNAAFKNGQADCKAWAKTASADVPFWSQFVKRYCTVMGVTQPIKDFDKKLYSKIEIKLDKDTVPKILQQMILADVNKQFKSRGWFDIASPRAMHLNLSANYIFSESKMHQQQSHPYNERVPYTEYEQQQKFDAKGNPYQVTEPVTKYRDEQRFYYYTGTLISQKIQFDATATSDVPQYNGTVFSFNKYIQETVHNENVPNIGLYPSLAKQTQPEASWLTQISTDYTNAVKKSLIADFNSAFCATISEAMSEPALFDRSLLCLREMINTPPDMVTRHFKDKFGLNVEQTSTLVKLID